MLCDVGHITCRDSRINVNGINNKLSVTKQYSENVIVHNLNYIDQISHNVSDIRINPIFWKEIKYKITKHHLYPEDPVLITNVLAALASSKIIKVKIFSQIEKFTSYRDIYDFGSTHKWLLELDGGQKAIFKPKW